MTAARRRTPVPTDLSPELEAAILTEWGPSVWAFLVAVGTDPHVLADIVEQANRSDINRSIRHHRDTAA